MNTIKNNDINTVKILAPISINKDYVKVLEYADEKGRNDIIRFLAPLSSNKNFYSVIYNLANRFRYNDNFNYIFPKDTYNYYKHIKNAMGEDFETIKMLATLSSNKDYENLMSQLAKHANLPVIQVLYPLSTSKYRGTFLYNAGQKGFKQIVDYLIAYAWHINPRKLKWDKPNILLKDIYDYTK